MSVILAIDPGPVESAYVVYNTDTGHPTGWGKLPNEELSYLLRGAAQVADLIAVEMIASYGMAVGAEVFRTCVWIGRFIEKWVGIHLTAAGWREVLRRDVKLHLCGDSRAKDANIRQALIDRYGGKAKAVGRKATPGPLYGLTGDCWSALAVAITAAETTS